MSDRYDLGAFIDLPLPDAVGRVRELLGERYLSPPLAYVHSFGCQQNASDAERIRGLLTEMGYGVADSPGQADFVLFNTCAVRENAEDRVFGNVGALKNQKLQNPKMVIALCGCMMQRQAVADKIKKSYPYVDIVFGTNAIHKLPAMLYERLSGSKRVFWRTEKSEVIEGLPTSREGSVKAWLPIMHGCDNFCSYCIVPYVRGREVSREPEDVLREAKEILDAGFKEITLLGQNVNSYGKGLARPINFSELLRRIDALPGDFWIRFMTSHPKDCTRELLDTIAESKHVCHHIHLPVQSGSDRILREMNRRYTAEHYLSLVEYARKRMPDATFSSDIMLGFPGETREDFLMTCDLVERVGYGQLFTFLYSKRSGTKAAELPDPTPEAEKSRWMRELLAIQTRIGEAQNKAMVGETVTVLVDSIGKSGDGYLSGRTENNLIAEFSGPKELIGGFARVRITRAMNWAVSGELKETGV